MRTRRLLDSLVLACIAGLVLAFPGLAQEIKALPWRTPRTEQAPPPPAPISPSEPAAQPTSWKALLMAADNAQPVFSNAVDALRQRLAAFGVAAADIAVLKADARAPASVANKANFDTQIARLAGPPSAGCFVFVTSHGMRNGGLVVTRANGILPPAYLAQALEGACANRPTVVITSGCFSGIYAADAAMRRPNRVILTAARQDLPSFGCSVDERYTFYDQCLLDSLDRGKPWRAIAMRIIACVERREERESTPPSYPQTFFGAQVATLTAF